MSLGAKFKAIPPLDTGIKKKVTLQQLARYFRSNILKKSK
jgi:hypothetical protein